MRERFKQSWRGYLIDHHSPDPPTVTLDNLNLEEYEDCFRLARVDQVMQYCKDHWGNCYYPSEVGRPHPALQGRDWVGEIQEMCGRNDWEFIAYYSVGFDTGAVQAHPEWALRTEEGGALRVPADGKQSRPYKWHWVCALTGYRQFACDHLREIVARYRPDSLFLDIFGQPLCFCGHCRQGFEERYGEPLPPSSEWPQQWRRMMEWQRETLHLGFLQDMLAAIRGADPEVPVTVNGGHVWHYPECLELLDYHFAEPWAGNFVSAGFARGTGKFPQVGPGGVSQVYNPHKPSIYIVEQANIVAQGVRALMFSGSQKPDGSLDRLEFRNIGEAYGEIEKFQDRLTERKPVPAVGLVFSQDTLFHWYEEEGQFADRYRQQDDRYRTQISGAVNDLAFSKYPYEVLPESRLSAEALRACEVVVLANHSCMSARTAELVREYVAGGGKLIATHLTSLKDERGYLREDFALGDVFGVSWEGLDRTYDGNFYASYLHRETSPLWEGLPDTTLALAGPIVKVRAQGEVLGRHILPATVLTEESWVCWWAPPPDELTDLPAAVHHRYGEGECLWLGFDVCGMSAARAQWFVEGPGFPWAREILTRALEMLAPRPPVRLRCPAPRAVGVTYFRRGDKLQVHLLNHAVGPLIGDVAPVRPGVLEVREDCLPVKAAAVVYPESRELVVRQGEGMAVVEMPEVELHSLVELE